MISISRAVTPVSHVIYCCAKLLLGHGNGSVCLPYNVVKYAMECTDLRCGRINNNVVKSNLLREASASGPG